MTGPGSAFLRKELRELLRDRKAILLSIVMPVLIYPVTMSFTSRLEERDEERLQDLVYDVALTGEAAAFLGAVERDEGLAVAGGPAGPDELRSHVREGEVEAWLHAPAESAAVWIIYHGPNDESSDARDRLRDLVEDVRIVERDARYQSAGGTESLDRLVRLEEVDVATEEESGGAKAGRFVPFLLIITLFIGGSALSTDIVAGEKERGTLETLYLTPVDRVQISRAKFFLVVATTTLTGVLNLASLLVCYRLGWIEEAGNGLVVSGAGVVTSFLLIFPLAALVGGVLLGISAYARTLKEAQYFMTPVMLLAFVPGAFAMSQEVHLDAFTALIPVANVALAIRDGLLGPVPPLILALVSIASIGWGVLAMRWTARMLSREETILGFDPEPVFSSTLSGRRRAALLGMAVTVLAFFYAGQAMQARDLEIGLALTLWVLLPALAAGTLRFAWAGGDLVEVLSLRKPSAAALAAAALLAAGTVIPMSEGVARIQGYFLPIPEEFAESFSGLSEMGMPLLLFLIAFSPGVCEEIVFRGAFLGLLRRVAPTRYAVLVSSVFFGVIHLSVFRFLPTFLLGLVLAGLTVRTRTIFPAMLFHMIYNGISVTLPDAGALSERLEGWPGWALSVGLLAAGWLLLRRGPSSEEASDTRGGSGA